MRARGSGEGLEVTTDSKKEGESRRENTPENEEKVMGERLAGCLRRDVPGVVLLISAQTAPRSAAIAMAGWTREGAGGTTSSPNLSPQMKTCALGQIEYERPKDSTRT